MSKIIINMLKAENIYIYGTGEAGKTLLYLLESEGIKVEGFFDSDVKKDGQLIKGKLVKSPQNFENLTSVTIIIASWYWRDITSYLKSNFRTCSLLYYFHFITDVNHFFPSDKEVKALKRLTDYLEDKISITTVNKLLEYRLTLNANCLKEIRQCNQYFCTLPKQIDYSSFFDIGGFDGDTIESLIKHDIKYNDIVTFEPDPDNFHKLQKRIENYKNIRAENTAVGKERGLIRFQSSPLGYNSKSSTAGNCKVSVIKIDDYVENTGIIPSCIKVDVEGMDLDVLKGATETIKRNKPALLVSCYHSPLHLHQIPLWIKENFPEYKLYLRHHSPSNLETICYALPG